MKNKNGITLITMVVIVTILLILTAVFVSTGLDALQEAKNTEIQNEIHQISQAISSKYASYIKNDGNISLPGNSPTNKWANVSECVNAIIATIDFSNVSSTERSDRISKITQDISEDYDKYVKIISSENMTQLGMDNFSSDNVYVVDYNTGSVYGPIND